MRLKLKYSNPADKDCPKELDSSWYILKTVSDLFLFFFLLKKIYIYNNNNLN